VKRLSINLVGPKVAGRRLKCRGCSTEISKDSEYWVEEGYEGRRWIGFSPYYGAPSFRYPTRVRYYLRKRVLCNTCKEKTLTLFEIKRREREERKRWEEEMDRKIDQAVTEFIFETLGKGEVDIYTFQRMFKKCYPKDGYDAKTGHYTGPTLSHFFEKLIKLVDEGVVEKIPDERFGYRYRLRSKEGE
jgi:hypothetical protein